MTRRARGVPREAASRPSAPFTHWRGDDEMTKHTAMDWTEQCDAETELSAKSHYLERAGDALLVGMT